MLCELLLWTVTRKQQFVGKVQCSCCSVIGADLEEEVEV